MFEGLLQPMHLVLILAIVLIIFGPGKLPEIGKTLGSGIREFRESVGHTTTESSTTLPAQPVQATSDAEPPVSRPPSPTL